MSELHYTTVGDGPPLVFVHGLAGSTRWWRHNTKGLSNHFKLYLIDLPGFGMTGSPRPLTDILASLPAWLDLLGLEKVHLVGHSMGGYVVTHFAATHPERVGRLALIDAAGIPLKSTLPHMIGRVLQSIPYGSPSFIPTVISDGLRAGIPTLLRLTWEILDVDARPLLRNIEAPTLILWGTRDKLLPPQHGLQMAKLIPNASFHFIPRAGHNAMADRPVLVNRHLLDFFCQALADEEPETKPTPFPELAEKEEGRDLVGLPSYSAIRGMCHVAKLCYHSL
jgi:pimeloyl-ACP methyl ester carboxylesterase